MPGIRRRWRYRLLRQESSEDKRIHPAAACWRLQARSNALFESVPEQRNSHEFCLSHTCPRQLWFVVCRSCPPRLGFGADQSTERTCSDQRDGITARFAAQEISASWKGKIRALQGGTAQWRSLGLPTENGLARLLDIPDDVRYAPRDRAADREKARREYLTWEIDLVNQIKDDEDCQFGL